MISYGSIYLIVRDFEKIGAVHSEEVNKKPYLQYIDSNWAEK